MPNYSIYHMLRKTITFVLWYPPFIFRFQSPNNFTSGNRKSPVLL